MQYPILSKVLGAVLLINTLLHAESIEYTTYVKVQKSVPAYEEVVVIMTLCCNAQQSSS